MTDSIMMAVVGRVVCDTKSAMYAVVAANTVVFLVLASRDAGAAGKIDARAARGDTLSCFPGSAWRIHAGRALRDVVSEAVRLWLSAGSGRHLNRVPF